MHILLAGRLKFRPLHMYNTAKKHNIFKLAFISQLTSPLRRAKCISSRRCPGQKRNFLHRVKFI